METNDPTSFLGQSNACVGFREKKEHSRLVDVAANSRQDAILLPKYPMNI